MSFCFFLKRKSSFLFCPIPVNPFSFRFCIPPIVAVPLEAVFPSCNFLMFFSSQCLSSLRSLINFPLLFFLYILYITPVNFASIQHPRFASIHSKTFVFGVTILFFYRCSIREDLIVDWISFPQPKSPLLYLSFKNVLVFSSLIDFVEYLFFIFNNKECFAKDKKNVVLSRFSEFVFESS